MLSENLQGLHTRLNEYVDTGMQLDPEGVCAVCAILKAAIEDARELESRWVPVSEQVADLPDNVVRIAEVLARKGVHVGPRNPEGAA